MVRISGMTVPHNLTALLTVLIMLIGATMWWKEVEVPSLTTGRDPIVRLVDAAAAPAEAGAVRDATTQYRAAYDSIRGVAHLGVAAIRDLEGASRQYRSAYGAADSVHREANWRAASEQYRAAYGGSPARTVPAADVQLAPQYRVIDGPNAAASYYTWRLHSATSQYRAAYDR